MNVRNLGDMDSGNSRVVSLQVPVEDPVATGKRLDYADAFVVDLLAPAASTPATWLGTGLSRVPPMVNWVAARLGFSSTTPTDPLDGWDVRSYDPDVVHLVVQLPLLYVDLIGRNSGPTRRMLTTLVRFQRPWLARLVWIALGPAHRRTVRWLLATSLHSERVLA